MAIIREYVADNGIRVRVADDCYLSGIELEQRVAQANRTILEVFAAAYLREQRQCAEVRERRMRGEAIRPDYAGDWPGAER